MFYFFWLAHSLTHFFSLVTLSVDYCYTESLSRSMWTTVSLQTLRKRQSKGSKSQEKRRCVEPKHICWICMLKNHFAHCLREMNYKVLKSLFLAARNCVYTKLRCRSNKTGLKTFPGVWLSFPWRRGMQRWKPAAYFFHSSPSFIQFAVFIYLFFLDESWWGRGRERHLRHPRGQLPARGRYGVEGDQLHSQHRLSWLGKVFLTDLNTC